MRPETLPFKAQCVAERGSAPALAEARNHLGAGLAQPLADEVDRRAQQIHLIGKPLRHVRGADFHFDGVEARKASVDLRPVGLTRQLGLESIELRIPADDP